MAALEYLLNDPSARRLKQWSAELPLANINALAQQLATTLNSLDQVKLTPASRLDILEAAFGPLRLTLEDFTRRLASQPFPISANVHALAYRSTQLIQTAINEYERVRTAGQSWIWRRLGRDRGLLATQRQLALYAPFIMQHRLVGIPLPAETWRAVHDLYRLVRQRGHERSRIDGPAPQLRRTRVANSYAELLLEALAPVQQLTRSELDLLTSTLPHWASLLRLRPATGEEEWCVDLMRDAPPFPAALATDTTPDRRMRLRLDFRRIAAAFRKTQKGTGLVIKVNGARFTLSESLVRTLNESWCKPPARRHERKLGGKDSVAIIGIGALNYLLAPTDLSELPEEEVSAQSGLSLGASAGANPAASPGERDIWDSVYFDPSSAGTKHSSQQQQRWNAIERNRVYHPLPVHIEDISASGVCLRAESVAALTIRGGDLIGIRSRRDHWHAGIIRWIQGDQRQLRIGVRLIAYDCQPMGIVAASPDRPSVRLPAVLGRLGDGGPVLAVPKLPSQVRHNLSATVSGVSYPLQFMRLRIDSPYFQLFSITPLPTPAFSAAPANTS